MQRELNKEWFEKYFFYGLENKEEVVKWIIVEEARQLESIHRELDMGLQKMNYEKEQETILELIVQLERFTSLHDDPLHREYFYDSINIDSIPVHQMFNRAAEKIKKTGAVSFVTYRPVSGIFFNTKKYPSEIRERYFLYSGEELLGQFDNWVKEVYEVLCYLNELEKENRMEYYSLFLDSKYARAINRYKNNITDDGEIREIRGVYRKFLESRSISGIDLKFAIVDNGKCEDGVLEKKFIKIVAKPETTVKMRKEIIEYIDKHYPEYDTITKLKTDAMGDKYNQRLKIEAKKVCDLFLKEKNIELEI